MTEILQKGFAAIVLITAPLFSMSELVLNTSNHRGSVQKICYEKHGTLLLTCSSDKTAKVWDRSGKVLRTLYPPSSTGQEGILLSCALSKSGETAIVGGYTGDVHKGYSVYMFSVVYGTMISVLKNFPQPISDLQFSSNEKHLAVGMLCSGGVIVYDLEQLKQISYLQNQGHILSCHYDRTGRLLTLSSDRAICTYNELYGEERSFVYGEGFVPVSAKFSPDGREIAIGFESPARVEVLDAFTLKLNYSLPVSIPGKRALVSWSADGSVVAVISSPTASEEKSVLIVENSKTQIPLPMGYITDISVLPDQTLLVAGLHGFGSIEKGLPGFFLQNDMLDFDKLLHKKVYTSIDGSCVGFTLQGTPSLLFSLSERKIISADLGNWNLRCEPGREFSNLTLRGPDKVIYSAQSGSMQIVANQWNLFGFDSCGMQLWRTALPARACAITLVPKVPALVVALADGTIRWFDLKNGKEVVSLYIKKDLREWALWSPDGLWEVSKSGYDLLKWKIETENGTGGALYDIQTMFTEKKSSTWCIEQTCTTTVSAKGTLQIVRPFDGDTISDSIVILLLKMKKGIPVTAVHIEVNGILQTTTYRGVEITQPRTNRSIQVMLRPGVNRVAVHIWSDNNLLCSKSITLYCKRKSDKKQLVRKPRLHALITGVSNYKERFLQLEYAAKDASDFAEILKKQRYGLYRDVHINLILDTMATKNRILDAFNILQRHAGPDDLTMVFVAGHGLSDPDGKGYFIPFDADTSRLKRTCIPFDGLHWNISRIPGKVILFLDACYAGRITSKLRAFPVVSEQTVHNFLQAEQGYVIISSASAMQFAREDRLWKNSAFTKALIEGIGGKADYEGKGIITITMLQLYLSKRVSELTGGLQTPVTACPVVMRDFPIAIVMNAGEM